VKSECLSFTHIPHTTPLFADFLYHPSKVRPFYARSPHITEWLSDEADRIQYPSARRDQVAAVLERQNRSWGASPQTLENISRFRAGAAALVTGQQVGLFGGPMFSVYKALTAVKFASFATANGVPTVPIFWLATEDHDLAEINQVSIPTPDGPLHKLTASIQSIPDAPVGTLTFGPEIQMLVDDVAKQLGEAGVFRSLRDCYRPGETFGSAFARFFTALFSEWGVILLDASDAELHRIAAPVYKAAIERNAELTEALQARGKELESAGYHQQVKVTASSTLLFAIHNGARIPIHRRSESNSFAIGAEPASLEELSSRIASQPQNFSANVLLRPVIQDYLLPTLAYAGGSAEIAYFAQAAVVYEKLLGRVTPIIPRFSATLVESKPASLLDRYKLSLPDVFQGPELLREELATRTLPKELQTAFDHAEQSMRKSVEAIRSALERLDKTLLDSADNSASKMQHQLETLRARAARAELRQTEVLGRHAELLANALYPNKTLQEREVSAIVFLARQDAGLLPSLYDSIHPDCLDHQVISV
jgi:bacillithiol synthase